MASNSKNISFQKQNLLLKVLKVLANANRLKVAKFLAQIEGGSANVTSIANATGIAENNLSNHLKLMRVAKILKAKQDGTSMYYSINEPLVFEVIASILK
jgi:DNA-binding transcriptional ArsR family regulator